MMNYNNHSLNPQISITDTIKSLGSVNGLFLNVSHSLVFPWVNEWFTYNPNFSPHPTANPSVSQKIK